MTIRTNTAASPTLASINFSIDNGVSNQWSILGSGVLRSTIAGANILMSNNQNINITNGATNQTTIQAAQIALTDGTLTTTLFGNILSALVTDFTVKAGTSGNRLNLQALNGQVRLSGNNGVANGLTVTSANELQTLLISAPFLQTDASGIIVAGSTLPTATTATNIAGGAAGSVPYQSAPSTTIFAAASDGVLQCIGTSVAFSATPTTLTSITAPTSQNLALSTPTSTQNISLTTNAGDIIMDVGGTDAWTVLGAVGTSPTTAGTLYSTKSTANIVMDNSQKIHMIKGVPNTTILDGGGIDITNASKNSHLDGNQLTLTQGTAIVDFDHNILRLTDTNYIINAVTAARTLSMRTLSGDIIFQTDGGVGTTAWSIASSSGVLSSARSGANILLSNSQSFTTVNGVTPAITSYIEPGLFRSTATNANMDLSTQGLTISGTASATFPIRNLFGGLQLISNSQNIDFSINGINNALTLLGATNEVRLDQIISAPFLTTNGSGVIVAGTVVPSASTAVSIAGGLAGQVLYQSGPGVTVFTNQADGIVQSLSNVVTLTDSPTTIKTITAKTAQDLSIINPTAAKKILINTNGGDMIFSTDTGTTTAMSISTGAVYLDQIISAPFLTTDGVGKITAGSTLSASLTGGSAGTVVYQSAANTTTFSNSTNGVLQNIAGVVNFSSSTTTLNSITSATSTDLTLKALTTSNKIKHITDAGDVSFNVNNGAGTDAWTVAGASGSLSSAKSGANLNLTASQSINSTDGANLKTIITPSYIQLTDTTTYTVDFYANLLRFIGPAYTISMASAAAQLFFNTAGGTTSFSGDNGANTALRITSTNGVEVSQITNAAFLKTDGTGTITAGSILPVSAGGTGVSSVTMPLRTAYNITGNIVMHGVCKYFTAEIWGGGGGGGAGNTSGVFQSGGGGGSGAYSVSHYPYNATAGYYSYIIGAGGTSGVNGGTTTFVANGFGVMDAPGGIGGTQAAGGEYGQGGLGGGYGLNGTWRGNSGIAGQFMTGGAGGVPPNGDGGEQNPNTEGAGVQWYDGVNGVNGGGGSGGNGYTVGARPGGQGGKGLVYITEYYY